MQSAIDTNVISALWSKEPTSNRMAELLGRARAAGGLVICAPVYAELQAHPDVNIDFVDGFLADTGIRLDFALSKEVWVEVGRTFSKYAERCRSSGGGQAKRLLVDFVVGAHAELVADQLLTLDPDRYESDFPNLKLAGG